MKKTTKRLNLILFTFIAIAIMITGCGTKTADSGASADTSAAASASVSSTAASSTAAAESTEAASTDSKPQIELLVSAAASLTDVAAEIAENYSKLVPNVKITYTFGASGALQTQIEEGAPSDIFMSAGKKQMTALADKSLVVDGANKDLLVNKVVLITPKDSTKDIKSFEDAASDKVSKIALGDPASVPVGQYSEEVFTSLGILDKVKAKANYGSDVRQVLTWVEGGEVDCGVVYSTDAMTSDKISVVCEAPKDSHKPIVYPVAVLKSSKHQEEAKAFLDYLSTPECKALFEKYGFAMN